MHSSTHTPETSHLVCSIPPHACTDPLCVVQNYHDEVHRVMAHNCTVGAVLTKTGSHLPFYEGLFMTNWAERVAFEFLDAFLASERAKESQ